MKRKPRDAAAPPKAPVIEERQQCPACGTGGSDVLYECSADRSPLREYLAGYYPASRGSLFLSGYVYAVCECRFCGLLFQRSAPAGPLLRDLYDLWIPKSDRERLSGTYTLDRYRYWAAEVDFLISHFRMKPHDLHVLDFGSGWGEWVNLARAFGCQVAGCEISAERVAFTRSLGITMRTWEEIPHHKVHFINTEQVFEHLAEPFSTLQHLSRALLPGGVLKVSVPNGKAVSRRLKNEGERIFSSQERLMPIAPLEHLNCFTYDALVTMGKKAGLEPVRPRLRDLYNASTGWLDPRQAARNLLRPLYRHWYPRSTYVYFTAG